MGIHKIWIAKNNKLRTKQSELP